MPKVKLENQSSLSFDSGNVMSKKSFKPPRYTECGWTGTASTPTALSLIGHRQHARVPGMAHLLHPQSEVGALGKQGL